MCPLQKGESSPAHRAFRDSPAVDLSMRRGRLLPADSNQGADAKILPGSAPAKNFIGHYRSAVRMKRRRVPSAPEDDLAKRRRTAGSAAPSGAISSRTHRQVCREARSRRDQGRRVRQRWPRKQVSRALTVARVEQPETTPKRSSAEDGGCASGLSRSNMATGFLLPVVPGKPVKPSQELAIKPGDDIANVSYSFDVRPYAF